PLGCQRADARAAAYHRPGYGLADLSIEAGSDRGPASGLIRRTRGPSDLTSPSRARGRAARARSMSPDRPAPNACDTFARAVDRLDGESDDERIGKGRPERTRPVPVRER